LQTLNLKSLLVLLIPVEQRVDRVVTPEPFEFDLEPEVVGAVCVDQCLLEWVREAAGPRRRS